MARTATWHAAISVAGLVLCLSAAPAAASPALLAENAGSPVEPAGPTAFPEPTPSPEPSPSAEPSPSPKSTPSAKPSPSPKSTPSARSTPLVKPSPTAKSTPSAKSISPPVPVLSPEPTLSAEPTLAAESGGSADPFDPSFTVSAEDAETQAALVDMEDQRLVQTRAALTALLQTGGIEAATRKQPQVFVSSHGRTLVLPARNTTAPYTLRDLMAVEKGRYVRRMKDGSYLLGVHVFVADGAKLQLRGPLTLRMGSLPGSFSSIIAFGGGIEIKGAPGKLVQITSWDVTTNQPDRSTADGRAYIRAVGGEFKMEYANVSHLGFWSGRTGGIALTGTERPASAYRHRTKSQRHQDKADRLSRTPSRGSGSYGDVETIPIGPGTASHLLGDELVSGSITNSRITGDAYGLFVSGSNQTKIVDNMIVDSVVHGVFMHRFAKNATIESTKVINSGGDGFVLSRATEKVRVTDCVAERNGRNGFTLNGRALAIGPSASGESLAVYGDSSVNNSVARDNGRYGIEVLGGSRLAVQTSEVIGGDMGIVVREGASGVQISGNKLTNQRRQAIALRDGTTDAHVAGNTIRGAPTGIYLRDADGMVVGNKITTLRTPKSHGITVVGDAGDSEITRNTLIGSGTSAVSVSRAADRVNKHNNDEDKWVDTSTFWVQAKRYVKPMNVIWAGVFLLVVVSAIRSRGIMERQRRRAGIRDPYEHQKWLEEKPIMLLRHATPSPMERHVTNGHANRHLHPSVPMHAGSTPTAGGS
ncbi:hypothetical protein Aph01nite_01220 [Acrocarpospora phusangensis]|uniref:Right handed beta helix domain-containing protein n=1 Tax=Acrocarpospora phusangensis TaxID=1070424 RepID=A0A919UL60_9ACTN|nr:right-handed parallel beta-helix repeat-containing protein [Acrocarpospora phusangensis]GIH21812.1 hypothetical protein Aph01nite_01220 [Acrocarpospora phusangensis]